jgi:septum formation protein
MNVPLILASASPRRSALLAQIGIEHRIVAADIDETPLAQETPHAYVIRMAAQKSAAVSALQQEPALILAADTSVICDGEILGKPRDETHCLEMLALLSGREHEVYSAVSLRRGEQHHEALSISCVRFRTLSTAEIRAYWHSGEPCDKAGGYAIQGLGSIFIESITGSFSGVMGLPLFETAQLLAAQGIIIIA